jgi:diphosphomevalonate decarboxylase
MFVETCTAPTNIAVIKYWGKDEGRGLNTPINSSASVTLEQDDLCAMTSIAASSDFAADRLWLNDKEESMVGDGTHAKRLRKCLLEMRALARDRTDASGKVVCKAAELASYKVHVVSRNTFPTAAGLASSAAGYACLVYTLAKLYNVKEEYEGQLSTIARQGSGSACRSLYGGFVKWVKGSRKDATDSMAVCVSDKAHWPELRAVILVINAGKKDTPSTEGMQTSVETSPLLAFRAASVVEPRLKEMEEAYRKRDFATFGKLAMQDSNQFHATCLDTYPPIFYLNDTSRQVRARV